MASTKKTATEGEATISIKRIERPVIALDIKGTAPLIMHRWSEKARKAMLDAMQGRKSPKEAKDPEAEFEAAAYRFEDGTYGFPAVAFKSAIVGAGRFFDGVTMTEIRQAVHVLGEGEDQLVRLRIDGPPIMREDTVRVNKGGTDLRYRPQFDSWSATLLVQYVPTLINEESVIALTDAAGMVGVGEWRPEKSGTFGTFELVAE